MAVMITQNPGEYNLASGINAITLTNIPPSGLKYVLQIRDLLGINNLADIRQAPNLAGVALFDIQDILKNYVNPSPAGVENTNGWVDSESETYEYSIYYGSEDNAGAVTIAGSVICRIVLSGRKEWNDITWSDTDDYRCELSEASSCTIVQSQGKLLTDYPTLIAASDLPGSVPSHISGFSGAQVYVKDLYATDNYSISAIQNPIDIGSVTARNISAARVVAYNSSGTVLSDTPIYNTTLTGGGPDAVDSENAPLVYPYWAITFPCGPSDSLLAPLPVGTAYYYVTLHSFQPTACLTPRSYTNLTEDPSFIAYRFNIIDPPCNDFDPVGVSWQNSFGFRDYWTFTKRWDEQYTAKRNEYLKNTFNWNGDSVSISQGAKGYTVFGQQLNQIYTIRTDWLTDQQSEFLKNLFVSADVRVKLPGSTTWDSVSLQSSTYDVKTVRKDRMFQYELRFRMANNLNSQRG